jgi:hypothetical protein
MFERSYEKHYFLLLLAALWPLSGRLGPPWAALGRSLAALGSSWAALGPLLGRSWLGSLLGRSWALFGRKDRSSNVVCSKDIMFKKCAENQRKAIKILFWPLLGALRLLLAALEAQHGQKSRQAAKPPY